jgi:hypothetical protein
MNKIRYNIVFFLIISFFVMLESVSFLHSADEKMANTNATNKVIAPTGNTNVANTNQNTKAVASTNVANPNQNTKAVASTNVANTNQNTKAVASTNVANPNVANTNQNTKAVASTNVANPNQNTKAVASTNVANPNVANTTSNTVPVANKNTNMSADAKAQPQQPTGKENTVIKELQQKDFTAKPTLRNSGVTVEKLDYFNLNDEVEGASTQNDDIRAKVEETSQGGVSKSILNPVFLIAEDLKTSNYVTSNKICNAVNIAKEGLECIVYSVKNKADIFSYMRRGLQSDKFKDSGVNGDFLIMRSDDYSQYLQGRGPFINSPKLDMVAYLNGDYFFIMAPRTKNAFNIDQLVNSMGKNKIRILVLNQQSNAVFSTLIKPLYPQSRFIIQELSGGDIQRQICETSRYDAMIFLGSAFPDEVKKSITSCSLALTPLSFSDDNIEQILSRNKMFISVNLVGYYNALSVLNFIEIFLSVEKEYKARIEERNRLEAEEKAKQERLKEEKRLKREEEAKKKKEAQDKKSNSPSKSGNKNKKSSKPKAKSQSKTSDSRLQNAPEDEVIEDTSNINTGVQLSEKEKMILNSGKKIITLDNADLSQDDRDLIDKSKPSDGSDYNISYLNKEVVLRGKDLKSLNGNSNSPEKIGVFPNIEKLVESKSAKSSLDISADAVIKSFGIRYVLVASRYAKRDHVFRFFNALVKNYSTMKDDFLGPDMKRYTAIDIALGNDNQTKLFTYHIGVYRYSRIMLEKKSSKTYDQALVIRNLSISLSNSPFPPSYGPAFPSEAQLNYIYGQLQSKNKKKLELNAVRILQRDLKNIEDTLLAIEQDANVPDSLLEATGLGIAYKATTIKREDPTKGSNLKMKVNDNNPDSTMDNMDENGLPVAETTDSKPVVDENGNVIANPNNPEVNNSNVATDTANASSDVVNPTNDPNANNPNNTGSNPEVPMVPENANSPANPTPVATPGNSSGNPAISAEASKKLALPE